LTTLVKRFSGDNEDKAASSDIDSSGNIFIAMTSYSSGMNHGKNDAVVLKMNSTGDKIWAKYFGGTEEDSLQDIKVNDLSAFVLGTTNSPGLTIGGLDSYVL